METIAAYFDQADVANQLRSMKDLTECQTSGQQRDNYEETRHFFFDVSDFFTRNQVSNEISAHSLEAGVFIEQWAKIWHVVNGYRNIPGIYEDHASDAASYRYLWAEA